MLYFVATPIGNLKDVTYRAIEVLNSVDEIACEDTRHSAIFLNYYKIKKPLFSYHKFNEKVCSDKIVEMLEAGKNIAVISDAGMPGISDPGNVLAQILIEKNIPYTVIPGACAFVSAMVLSGWDSSRFTFVGFLPEKKRDYETLLEKYASLDSPLIFYSAPHDVDVTVKALYSVLGDRKAVAVREITKIYEERTEFQLKDGYPSEKRGEFVIIVEGAVLSKEAEELTPQEQVKLYVDAGINKMDAIKRVARERNLRKNELYKIIIDSEENAEKE